MCYYTLWGIWLDSPGNKEQNLLQPLPLCMRVSLLVTLHIFLSPATLPTGQRACAGKEEKDISGEVTLGGERNLDWSLYFCTWRSTDGRLYALKIAQETPVNTLVTQ